MTASSGFMRVMLPEAPLAPALFTGQCNNKVHFLPLVGLLWLSECIHSGMPDAVAGKGNTARFS